MGFAGGSTEHRNRMGMTVTCMTKDAAEVHRACQAERWLYLLTLELVARAGKSVEATCNVPHARVETAPT